MKTLRDLFEHEIKDLYSAEKQLTEALPKMAIAANDPKLKEAFQEHLAETKQQFERISKVCEMLDVNPGSTKCAAMEGLIEEGDDMIKEEADADVKDAGLIASAQRVEHYEISGYGTARHFANMLDGHEAAELLEETLNEEKQADEKLNDLAIDKINKKAQ